MPWKETTTMSLRTEFIHLAGFTGTNFSQLCRRFGISRKTGYKWLKRYQEGGGFRGGCVGGAPPPPPPAPQSKA
jgi:transposase-like protein